MHYTLPLMVLAIAFLGGCSASQERPDQGAGEADLQPTAHPSWYRIGGGADQPGDGFIYGYGMGESTSRREAIEEAHADARRAIASHITTIASALNEVENEHAFGRAAMAELIKESVPRGQPQRSAIHRRGHNARGEPVYNVFYQVRVEASVYDHAVARANGDALAHQSEVDRREEALRALQERRALLERLESED